MINTTSENLKAGFYSSAFYILLAIEISCSVELTMKQFSNLGAWTKNYVAKTKESRLRIDSSQGYMGDGGGGGA